MFPICHSTYSLGWGVSSPQTLCRQTKILGYQRLCIADQNNLYGLPEFIASAAKQQLVPIIGAEITSEDKRQTLILLVKNSQGYKNLCRIISCRHCHPDFNLTTTLIPRHTGLIGLSGDCTQVTRLQKIGLETYLDLGMVPKQNQLPLQRMAAQQDVNITTLPHCLYATRDELRTHQLLQTITLKKTIHAKPHSPCHTMGEMPLPAKLSCNSVQHIERQCAFTGPSTTLIMPPYKTQDHTPPEQELLRRATTGATTRYGTPLPTKVKTRLEYELGIINRMHFAAYFLVVQDIVRRRGKNGRYRRICGRGSGAASLVAYCLHITNICPIKHNLYFERFLHLGRKDPPDIDIDFAWDEREDVLREIFGTYKRHVAMVCNHVFYQPKMAVREIAKAYGLPEHEISQVTKKMHWLNDTLFSTSQNKTTSPHGHGLTAPWPQIMIDAQRIIGLPRHLSVHPGGVIITPEPISSYVPVQYTAKQIPIIQWQKDGAEFFGLVKIDILGNRSLGVIRDAIDQITASTSAFNAKNWNGEDDPATCANISRGGTMGCFYIESPAMRLLQKKAGSGDFEQLVIQSSIIRPAANEFTREYVRRLRGGTWSHLHPSLHEVLNTSFGLMVYQEDVSRVAIALAGFSHERADGLRKVLSKKDKGRTLQDFELEFQRGATKHGIPHQTIQKIWHMIMSFNGYSFCKPHSASYAKVSFQAAYLKTHYPAQFMAAVLSNKGGYYSTFAYISEAKRLGVQVKPPCVNRSQASWSSDKNMIRTGLLSVRGLSHKTCQATLSQRQDRPFTSTMDFLERVSPSRHEAIALIHAGGLSPLSATKNRSILLWDVALYFHNKKSGQTPRGIKHHLLQTENPTSPHLKAPSFLKKRREEFKALGFLTSCHPLSLCISTKQKRIIAKNIAHYHHKKVCIAGWLIAGKLVRTKKGDPMEFLSFEDETGLFETTFFPGAYRQYGPLLEIGFPYLLTGRVDEDFGACTIVVNHVQRL